MLENKRTRKNRKKAGMVAYSTEMLAQPGQLSDSMILWKNFKISGSDSLVHRHGMDPQYLSVSLIHTKFPLMEMKKKLKHEDM